MAPPRLAASFFLAAAALALNLVAAVAAANALAAAPGAPLSSWQLDRSAPTVVPPGKDVVTKGAGATATDQPVVLLWRINFGPEEAPVPVATAPAAVGGGGAISFSATIPLASSAAKEGDMLRWRLKIGSDTFDPPEAPEAMENALAASASAAPPQQQPQPDRARYLGALVSSLPTALTPAPRPLEPSFAQSNLDLLSSKAIPEIHWWHPNESRATSDLGAPGGALYLPAVLPATGSGDNSSSSPPAAAAAFGTFHDAVFSERRGVTALAWAKPKLKFAPQDPGVTFPVAYAPRTGARALKINSYHAELGDGPSMLREAVGLAVLAESGVAAPQTHYVRLFLNGRLLGLFGMVEDVDRGFLARRGLPSGAGAPIFESVSGELSNLRGDLPPSELPAYWGKSGDARDAADWRMLDLFVKGLDGAGAPGDTGGSGNGSSSSFFPASSGPRLGRRLFVMDALDLPAVVNEAAAQTVLGNMDRCTKNFYVHVHSATRQWRRFPWDVEASLGQDNGLGGKPGDLYSPLSKEQWNSPLYCDSEHPQDIDAATGRNLNTYHGAARGAAANSAPALPVGATSGRRRRRRSLKQKQQRILAEGVPLQTGGWPTPVGWDDPDAVPPGVGLARLGAPPAAPPPPSRGSGARYTYNHLTDALLDAPDTRAMYLRRLRTLADAYYGTAATTNGREQQQKSPRMARLVQAHWAKIEGAAKEDARLWARLDPSRGVEQILTEYVPIRTRQLLGAYGPDGVRPLLPYSSSAGGAQRLRIARVEAGGGRGGGGGGGGADGFVEIANDADFAGGAEAAVDASGWTLRLAGGGGGGWSWRLPAGLVLPGGRSAFVARDVAAFRARGASPRGGEGLIVVDGSAGALPGAGSGWELLDAEGAVVSTL